MININDFKDMEEHLEELGITSKDDSSSEDDVLRIEKRYKIKIPEIYKLFLFKYGDCTIEQEIRYRPVKPSHYTDKDGLNDFGSFFGFEEGMNNIGKIIKQYYERVPNSLIPIADDGLGNLVCIGVKDEYRGKIYFWNHEDELMAHVMLNEKEYLDISIDNYWNNIFLIAESFLDFIKSFIIIVEDQGTNADSKILRVDMSNDFIARMLAARTKLEAKAKAKRERSQNSVEKDF